MKHVPVLSKEVIEVLKPGSNENFIDGTIGQGGHARLILEKTGPNGKLLGIDWDQKQIENCREELLHFKDRLVLVNDSYSNLENIVKEKSFENVSGILIDLGYSSWHLAESGRGFSFQKDESLDMRYEAKNNDLTAQIIINDWPERELEKIFSEYGEEKFSKRIASKIAEERKSRMIQTTFELAEVIKEAVPSFYWRGPIHYATRTFQALRIAVNKELENLEKVLPKALSILEKEGRLAIISFHSLEDRIVKNFLKSGEKENILKIINKKPILATDQEKKDNPRSRSAKLRAAYKI